MAIRTAMHDHGNFPAGDMLPQPIRLVVIVAVAVAVAMRAAYRVH